MNLASRAYKLHEGIFDEPVDQRTNDMRDRNFAADPAKPLARLVRNTLTVADIVTRPLWCLRPDMPVTDALDAMVASGFDVAGVTGSPISHFVRRESLQGLAPKKRVRDVMQPILGSQCIERALPIGQLLELMREQNLFFVLDGAEIGWLVNHSDLSATVVSIAVLAHLAAIEEGVKILASSFDDDHVLNAMKSGLAKAQENFEKLTGDNIEVSIFDCFYFKDWMNFVRKTDEIRTALGFRSRSEFKDFSWPISELRNHTAHGRGVLAAAPTPSAALKAVGDALDFVARVWALVDAREPIWDRFVETQIVFANRAKRVLAGYGARTTWEWSEPVHVITAWNPSGIWVAEKRNAEANERLLSTLERHGATTTPVIGRSPDGKWREASFLVEGLKRQQMAELGVAFGQMAFFELEDSILRVIRSSDAQILRTRDRVQITPM